MPPPPWKPDNPERKPDKELQKNIEDMEAFSRQSGKPEVFCTYIGLTMETNEDRRRQRIEDSEPFDEVDHRNEEGWPDEASKRIRPTFWYNQRKIERAEHAETEDKPIPLKVFGRTREQKESKPK